MFALRSEDGASYGTIDPKEAARRIGLFESAEAGLRHVVASGLDEGDPWLLLLDPGSGEWELDRSPFLCPY